MRIVRHGFLQVPKNPTGRFTSAHSSKPSTHQENVGYLATSAPSNPPPNKNSDKSPCTLLQTFDSTEKTLDTSVGFQMLPTHHVDPYNVLNISLDLLCLCLHASCLYCLCS